MTDEKVDVADAPPSGLPPEVVCTTARHEASHLCRRRFWADHEAAGLSMPIPKTASRIHDTIF